MNSKKVVRIFFTTYELFQKNLDFFSGSGSLYNECHLFVLQRPRSIHSAELDHKKQCQKIKIIGNNKCYFHFSKNLFLIFYFQYIFQFLAHCAYSIAADLFLYQLILIIVKFSTHENVWGFLFEFSRIFFCVFLLFVYLIFRLDHEIQVSRR